VFDPYLQWLGLSPQDGPPTPFQMVGLPPGSYSPVEIQSAAEKQMQRVRQHQQGSQGFHALKLIGEILEARDSLLDPAHQRRFVPATVPTPVDDKAWYHEEQPQTEPTQAPTLEITAPDLSEAKTKSWWVGDGGGNDTAPAEALSDQSKGAWWIDHEEVEPVVVPPPPPPRVAAVEPPAPVPRAVEPIEPEHRDHRKMILAGGLVAALLGVGVVILLVKQNKPTPVVIPQGELVLKAKADKEPPSEAVWGVALARDGSEFFSVGVDKQLFARQLDEPKSRKKHQFLEGGVQVVHGSADNLLAACDGSQVVVFDPDANQPRRKIVTPGGGFRSLALHANGIHLLTGSTDGQLRWWNVLDDKLETTLEVGAGKEISSLAISPNGSLAMAGTVDGKVFLIDAVARKVVHSLPVHAKKVTAVAVSPNGERGASVSEDKFVQLWDLTKKSLARKLPAHPNVLLGVGWSSDSRRILTCGLDPTLRIFDADNGKQLWSAPLGEKSYSLAVDSKDRFVAVGGEQGTIQLIPLPRISTEEIAKDTIVQPPADKMPTPGVEEVKLARLKVREKYAADFERRLPAEIASLVEKLLQQGVTVKHDPAYRQALFDEAAELAQIANMLDEAMRVAEGRALWFLSDELEEKTQAIEYVSTKAPNPMQRAVAERTLAVLAAAQKADRYELVERLLKVAEASARFSGIKEVTDRVAGVQKQVQGILGQKARVAQARMRLQTTPDDPEANYLFGRSLCLTHASWAMGLQHLVKGNEEKWKSAAKLDLSDPKDAPTQYKLATNWFEIAATVSEDEKINAFSRARLWYERAIESGLTGTDKLDAQTKVRNIKGMK
jgi:hypothetical protein